LPRIYLGLAVAANLGLLCWFKYANFFVQDILVGGVGLHADFALAWETVVLPLGISFYTFQAMSYVIDVYRRVVPATGNFVDFACYVTSFPQLVAGPIVRYKDIAEQLLKRSVTPELFHAGVNRFIIGLAKKMLIANTVAQTADAVFALPHAQLDATHAWLGVLCYTIQIYFDFSGYSDMAIGLGLMLGFTFPENFDYPYISRSIQEFWRRWHISLSTWFRDYLYIPLGGNRGAPWRTYFNLWVVFLLCGLWHGASWNFIAWGAFHGLFLVLERGQMGAALCSMPSLVRRGYTLLVIIIGWTLFRADSLPHFAAMLRAMFGLGQGANTNVTAAYYAGPDILTALVMGMILSAPLTKAIPAHWRGTSAMGAARTLALVSLLIVSATAVASGTYNPFLYFRF
jgi:alginate O-acetyltransferase complex protein AlgI